MILDNIPAGKELPEDLYCVIEIPQNADPIKYEIDKELLKKYPKEIENEIKKIT